MPRPYQSDDHEDLSWLTDVVLEVATHYSRPHEQVLALTSLADDAHEDRRAALEQAAESASRLDRTVEIRVVDTASSGTPHHTDEPAELESAPGLVPSVSGPQADTHRTGEHATDSGVKSREGFNTVIAYVDSRSGDWVESAPWGALLGPVGLLAVITHSDIESDLADFRSLLADTAQRVGLVQLDQLVLASAPSQKYANLLIFIRPLPALKGETC